MKINVVKKLGTAKKWPVLGLILSFLFLLTACGGGQVNENGVLTQLKEKDGYLRTVGAEEYAFFEKLVLRNSASELSEEELKSQTEKNINRANALFMLGNRMELCTPYSFESFQLNLEHENSQRKLKKEKGEVFYGPVEFTLNTYYEYVTGNLKLDMVRFITDNADSEVLDGAKAYFEEHKESYNTIESVTYHLTKDGKTEKQMVLYKDFSTLEKTDEELFTFLYNGKEGEVLESVYQESSRTIEILSVKYEELTFKNHAERVMRDYITNVYLENWLCQIEADYPVEIKF